MHSMSNRFEIAMLTSLEKVKLYIYFSRKKNSVSYDSREKINNGHLI